MVSSQPFAADSMSLLHSAAENMRAVSPDAACPSSRSAIRRAVVRGANLRVSPPAHSFFIGPIVINIQAGRQRPGRSHWQAHFPLRPVPGQWPPRPRAGVGLGNRDRDPL